MDNHKDFIHIDDVFKDLRNGEEQEPSGAWLRMKDLLDKEMPAGAPVSAGKSFRRYLVPLVALLLAGGGFTYYKMNQDSKNALPHGSSHMAVATTPAAMSDKTGELTSETSKTPKTVTHKQQDPSPAAGNNMPGNHVPASGKETSATAVHDGKAGRHEESASRQAVASRDTRTRPDGARTSVAGGLNTTPARPGIVKVKDQYIASGDAKEESVTGRTLSSIPVIEQQRVIEEIRPAPTGSKPVNQASPDQHTLASSKGNGKPGEHQYNADNNLKELATRLNDKKIVQTANGELYKEERDTFKRIDVVARTVASGDKRTTRTKFDTVAITRIEKVTYVPLNALEMVAVQKMKIASTTRPVTPIANLRDKIVSNEMVSMVPLANYKVASRRVDPGKFNQLVQNTSQGISNYFDGTHNFYAALLFGGNSSFGNPGAFGLQFGLAGLYQLSERLTLAAELKYVNHYFSNYSLDDKSVTFENVSSQQLSGADWLFSGTQRTINSAYKINSYGALEMPIMLNYNLGRVSVFGGLNIAFGMPINWSKENTVNVVDVQKNSTENTNPFLASAFQIDEKKDFSSRFGVGYVWGLDYDFSRKLSLDVRLAQILQDNSKGNTDAIKRLFQVPTLQVSIGYFFGRKDKVVYIMDKR